jgi:uncharacterized damage-inducible protein DinB
MNINFTDLIDYTDWEREKWHLWLKENGNQILTISLGANGDGRFEKVGDWVRHIFSAEKRYVERLSNRALTETASVPADNVEALFAFAQQSRSEFKQFLATLSEADASTSVQFKLMNTVITATPKKILTHVLIHEMRHWAQIATLLRLNGERKNDFHDFLFSPAMAGE